MEPIFDRVATWQRFAGAEEVMERMDTLENMCVDLSTQLADTQDALGEARKRAEAAESRESASASREREDERARVAAAAAHAAEHQSTREALANAEACLATMRDRDEAYLTLRNEVHDLWTRWISGSDLVARDEELRLEGLDDTTTLLRHLREMLVMHSPTLAGTRLRKVQEVANSAWRRFFKNRLDIRGDPLAVVAALEELCVENAARVEALERRCAAANKEEREQRGEVQGYKVAARRAWAEAERLRSLSGTSTGHESGGGHRAGKKKTSTSAMTRGTKRGGDARGGAAAVTVVGGGEEEKEEEEEERDNKGSEKIEDHPSTMKASRVEENKEKKEGATDTAVKVDDEEGDGVRLEKTAAAAAAPPEPRFPLSIGNRGIHRSPSSISRSC